MPEFQTQYEQSTELDQIELLYQDIYKVFGDLNKQAMVIQEITTIKQGSKSAEEHVQLFKQSYMRSGYGEIVGIHELKQLLNSPLLDKCMAIPEFPITLEKWYELVIWLDHQWRQAVAERKVCCTQKWQHRQTDQCNTTPPVQLVPRDPNAMQVDQNCGPFHCYNCGQTSHMAHVCPNPRQQQTCLVSTWNSGTDAERDELWWMVAGGGEQVGGSVAHAEEIHVEQPAVAQITQTAPQNSTFPFSQ
ncbi:hypothetical protein AMATHDRAFT_162641 [Amanita thiersii Skay4041]|uniref:CCHC-type domain-containing protein n=1 Tax=Amanita thiersii Skay4041 TaxID=703135 RepID=A0A2A9NBI9_9AGAR|nr:hypothetical protein AMATHDRAFT_162641 [Amanita thiersii Skay4041]